MGASLYMGESGHDHDHPEEGHEANAVGFMVTFALFLHKAPEAAGYGTFIAHMKISEMSRFL